MRARRRLLPLLLVVSLGAGVAGCGGGKDKDPDAAAISKLPKIKQNEKVPVRDVERANEICRLYQKKKPKGITQFKFRIPGEPGQPCIVQ